MVDKTDLTKELDDSVDFCSYSTVMTESTNNANKSGTNERIAGFQWLEKGERLDLSSQSKE